MPRERQQTAGTWVCALKVPVNRSRLHLTYFLKKRKPPLVLATKHTVKTILFSLRGLLALWLKIFESSQLVSFKAASRFIGAFVPDSLLDSPRGQRRLVPLTVATRHSTGNEAFCTVA